MRLPWLLATAFAAGCHGRLVLPDLAARPGPFFPAPPDVPRVAYVGEIAGPPGGFVYPLDVACGPGAQLAVADPRAGAVWRLDLADARWSAVREVGGAPLQTPVGVAFQADGSLVVVDSSRALVARWDPGRRVGSVLAAGAPLLRPVAAAALPEGGLVIGDTGAHRLFVLAPGRGVAELGPGPGDAGGGLNAPTDVVVGPDGAVWAVDALEAVLLRVGDGALERVAGRPGTGGDALVRPKGVAFAPDGNLHVVDAGMQHVQVYTSRGELLGRYGRPGDEPESLGLPGGLCIDDEARVFVSDPLHARVQVYALLPGE